MSLRHPRLPAREGVDCPGAYRTAYAVSVLGSAISAGLTYMYVGGGVARELNPVIAAVIETVGPAGMILFKMSVVIAAYNALYWISVVASIPRAVVVFGWIGAAVNALDALHDFRVAAVAGLEGTKEPHLAIALLICTLLAGAFFAPR